MKALRFFLIVVITSIIGASAWAEEPVSAAVLNLEADGVSQELADTLTSVVRNEAQQIERYKVVNTVAINFQDILMVLGCSEDSTVCLKRAAAEVEARILMFGRVSKRANSLQITLNIFDAEQGKMIEKLTRTISDTDDPVGAFRKEILVMFGGKDPEVAPATMLRIGSNVENAQVSLQDKGVGGVPLERAGLPPGKYKVVVSHPDYEPWETIIQLKVGNDVDLWAPLKKKAGVVEAKIAPETHTELNTKVGDERVGTVNWGAWSTIGVGSAALVGSGVFVLLMNGVEGQLETEAGDGTLTEQRYDELTSEGESYELTHQILLGVGAVAVISGVVWLLLDERDESALALELEVHSNGVEASLHW